MRVANLIERVERLGGRFVLEDRKASLSWPEKLSEKQRRKVRKLDAEVRKHVYLVTAELLEREFSRQWERDFACHCGVKRFAHPPHRVPDVWGTLKAMLRAPGERELDEECRRAIEFDDYVEERKRTP